ncbi:MAG: hypothetical protein Q7S92_04280 [Candidatus Diapherotrites archaeon]|nr:hypothetical protein [Candidatus Diapherotrites archaeon]
MQFKYCPECAGLENRKLKNGLEECLKCGYSGSMNTGPMDEVNAVKKKLGNKPITRRQFNVGDHKDLTPNQLKEKLEALKGKKSDEVEFL